MRRAFERRGQRAPRARRSQRANPVTGRPGSVQPIGHPITQSEKFGLKLRSPGEYLGPVAKFRWSGREQGKRKRPVGFAPVARTRSQISVNVRAALPIDIWLPFRVGSSLNFSPSAESSSDTLLA